MYVRNGQKIQEGQAFVIGDVQYPSNWLELASSGELTALGIAVVADPPRPDSNIYLVTENADGTYTAVPKDPAVWKPYFKARINEARDAEEAAGFDYLGNRFDSDEASIRRLYGAAMAAQAALAAGVPGTDPFLEWTCADGSVLPLTYEQAAAFPVAMAQTANTLHVKARALKAQIDAALTPEECEAVQW